MKTFAKSFFNILLSSKIMKKNSKFLIDIFPQ